MMEQRIISVTELNRCASAVLENEPLLRGILVRGEISNFKPAPSGHWYFSLKDRDSTVSCTLFVSQQRNVRFRPENGMVVLVSGIVRIYSPQGKYQISCESMMPMNEQGDLAAAFEQLKRKLDAEGLFREEHKKKLPVYPDRIGLITSDTGAAVRDMIRILRKRWPLTDVVVLPVRVQGAEAAGEIAAAVRQANRLEIADILIVGRGGGSAEDLWAFNEEIVARAIYASEIPVISAVGHEPDVVISDYVADRRAATPSNAAEIAVPDQNELRQRLDLMNERLLNAVDARIASAKAELEGYEKKKVLKDPTGMIEVKRYQLSLASARLAALAGQRVQHERSGFLSLAASLDAMSPLKVLTRGYSIAIDRKGKAVTTVDELLPGSDFTLKVSDGEVPCMVKYD